MKKIWTKPMATVEEFAANEYVAACGDEHRVYKFTCDALAGTVYYYGTSDGKIDGYGTSGRATELGSYKPCADKHEAPTTGDFYDGFVDRDRDGVCDEGENAIIWVEWSQWFGYTYASNWHATENLKMDEWETAKS